MNPNTTIRPWLLACGEQFGIRQAHEYRWSDAKTRQHEMYCTYQIISSTPRDSGTRDMSSSSGYDVSVKGIQQWVTRVQVDLYNSQDGLYELAAFCVGADHVPAIRSIFGGKCAFIGAVSVDDYSEFDDAVVDYHQRLICDFYENVEISITDVNSVVDSIDVTGAFVNMDRENSFIPATETVIESLPGSATFVEA
jgi:hypothetical protein